MGFSLLKPKPWIHIPDICPAHSWKYSNAWEFYLSQTKVQLKLPIFAWMHIPFLSFLDRSWEFWDISQLNNNRLNSLFSLRSSFLWCVDSLYFDLRFKLRIVNFTERLLLWETTSIVSVLYLLCRSSSRGTRPREKFTEKTSPRRSLGCKKKTREKNEQPWPLAPYNVDS